MGGNFILRYFNKGVEQNLPPEINSENVFTCYVTTDKQNFYIDLPDETKRIRISDFIDINNDSELPESTTLDKFYFSKESGALFRYINGEWRNISGSVQNLSYNSLTNKPSINGVVLEGNITLKDLGLDSADAIKSLTDQIDNILNGTTTIPRAESSLSAFVAASSTNSNLVDGKSLSYIMDYNNLLNKPTNLITEEELAEKNFLTSIPEEYITNEELSGKGYATETYVTNLVGDISSLLDTINGEVI